MKSYQEYTTIELTLKKKRGTDKMIPKEDTTVIQKSILHARNNSRSATHVYDRNYKYKIIGSRENTNIHINRYLENIKINGSIQIGNCPSFH